MRPKGRVVFFGELLMRLETKRYERLLQAAEFRVGYTGAEANVAVSLANYGLETYVVSAVPATEIGQACINHIRQYGVRTEHVRRSGSRLGIFYLETGVSQRPSKVIYDRAGSSITELRPGDIPWDEIFEDKDWFHFSGTAPALADNVAAVTAEACTRAKALGLTVSCDLNFRRKLWTPDRAYAVMTPLMSRIDLFVMGREDAEKIFRVGSAGSSAPEGAPDLTAFEETARQLAGRFGLRYLATTLRESPSASETYWSGMLYDGERLFGSRRYRIQVVDRVGGGDAFSGGIIYGLLTGMPPQETVEFAAAASCLKHTIHGDVNLASIEEVRRLMEGEDAGRVRR